MALAVQFQSLNPLERPKQWCKTHEQTQNKRNAKSSIVLFTLLHRPTQWTQEIEQKNQSIPAPSHQQEPTPFEGSDNPNSQPTPKYPDLAVQVLQSIHSSPHLKSLALLSTTIQLHYPSMQYPSTSSKPFSSSPSVFCPP